MTVEIWECEGHGFYFEWVVDGEYVAVTGTDSFIPDGAVLHTYAEWVTQQEAALGLDEPDDLGTYPDAAEIYEATAGHGMEEGER